MIQIYRFKFKEIIFFFVILIYGYNIKAKDNDGNSFTCADEIGPVLEFSIPKFVDVFKEVKTSIKIADINDRSKFINQTATIQKKTSPIDRTYFFYDAKFTFNDSEGYFEFFPPSHLMIKNKKTPFKSLVCWQWDFFRNVLLIGYKGKLQLLQ